MAAMQIQNGAATPMARKRAHYATRRHLAPASDVSATAGLGAPGFAPAAAPGSDVGDIRRGLDKTADTDECPRCHKPCRMVLINEPNERVFVSACCAAVVAREPAKA